MSITLYLVAWPGNLRDPIAASADAGSTGNVLHLIGAVPAALAMLREDERLGQAPAVV